MSKEVRIVKVWQEPEGRYRLETEDRCYLTFRPAWSSPLSRPGRYLALLDGKDGEITTIPDPQALPPEVLDPLMAMVEERYLSPMVTEIRTIRMEFGITYWDTMTERGRRDFATQSLQENVHWLAPGHLIVTDVSGNRYEVHVDRLDPKSRRLLGNAV